MIDLDELTSDARDLADSSDESRYARYLLSTLADALESVRAERDAALAAADAVVTVEQIADEIAGHPIGSGYYQTTVGVDEAREIADAVVALLRGEVADDES